MKSSHRVFLLVAVAFIAMLVAIPTVAFAAPLKGAIFTTTEDGSIVNENVHYEAKIDVYLDGGPPPNAPQKAASLPDGDYVFQVTDPSGKVLLSQDAAQWRVFRVEDGVIVTLRDWTGIGNTFFDHTIDDAGHKEGKSYGKHDTNTDVDHGPPAIVVQLMPFLDTPNPGGVYKAWITPVDTYLAKGGNLGAVPSKTVKIRGKVVGFQPDPGFGPPHDQVKTDNFKVKEFFPPEIRVRKFHDKDADGVWDEGEPEIGVDEFVDGNGNIVPSPLGGGWPFTVFNPSGNQVNNTYYTPRTIVAGEVGSYSITEGMFDHWKQTAAYLDGVALSVDPTVKVTVAGISGEKHEVVFGNVHLGNIRVCKFYDANRNAIQDPGEELLEGWQFTLYYEDGTTIVTTDGYGNSITNPETTSAGGCVVWEDLLPGTYVVKETLKSGWVSTTGLSQTVQFESCTAETTVKFGNFRAKGLTPGFWKNWRNHFSDYQFTTYLLPGTIAPDISAADAIFASYDASPNNELTILKAMLLANQLTLNLSAWWPDNPYGWLAPYVSINGIGTLQDAINEALAILANPSAYTRWEILAVKDKLDAFANLN